jgi:hypothetical protein
VKTLIAFAVAAVLLAVPSAGFAQTQLPVGEAHGVKVVREHKAIVIVLSPKLQKRYAGKLLVVSCTTLLKDGANLGSEGVRVPVHGRKLRTGDTTGKIDFCRVLLPRHRGRSKHVLVSVPLTQKGAVFIDEETKTIRMLSVLAIASILTEDKEANGVPTYDELIQAIPKRARAAFAAKLVALATPADAPPVGKVGYYGDGEQQVTVATVSALGRRLFIAYGPDDVFSTNVLGYIFNERE